MSRMWVVLGLCLFVAGVSGCDGAFDDDFLYEHEFRFTEAAEGIATLDLASYDGSVLVRGEQTNEVGIVAKRHVRATHQTEGQVYADGVTAEVRADGDTLIIRTVMPIGSRPSYVDEARIDFDVVVPADMKLRVESDKGAVQVVDVSADVRIRSSDGAITIENVLGEVDAETSNGAVDATFDNVQGRVSIRTSNGSIGMLVRNSCGGTVSLESSNGAIDLRVRELLEPADLRTSNGRVTLVVERELAADVQARTFNGAIEVRLPFDASFDLTANTGNGVIETEWGRSDGFLDLEINGGDNRVDLESSAGPIHVTGG